MLVVQMLLPRFLVLEVLLFLHFLQQSHAVLHFLGSRAAAVNEGQANTTDLQTDEAVPLPAKQAVDVIVKTDRVARSTVTVAVAATDTTWDDSMEAAADTTSPSAFQSSMPSGQDDPTKTVQCSASSFHFGLCEAIPIPSTRLRLWPKPIEPEETKSDSVRHQMVSLLCHPQSLAPLCF